MNLSEVAVASAIGLTAVYFGRVVLLNSVRSWHNKGHVDVPSAPTRPTMPEQSNRCPNNNRDQRPITLIPYSNRGQQPSRKNPRPRR